MRQLLTAIFISTITYAGALGIHAEGDLEVNSISIPGIPSLNIVKMATDYALPYIYLAHTSSTSPNKSSLIWYNTDTGTIEQVLDAGENITDITVSYADNCIYVSNWKRAETRVFDRSSKSELEPLSLGTDVYRLNAVGVGQVITEAEEDYFTLLVRNTATGTSINLKNYEREGDGDGTLDGRYYYHTDNNISDASLSRYTRTGKTFASEISTRTKYFYGSRNVFVSMDGSRVYNCGTIYDADLNEKLDIGTEIYAASAHGELVVTGTKAFNGVSGQALYSLPFSCTVMAFSGDQSELLLFNAASRSITSLATSVIMPLEPGMLPTPAVGSIEGANLPELSWSSAPAASGYNVYIGTDLNAVASATTNSLEYLGQRTDPKIQLNEGTLTGNKTYFWRVDIVAFGNEIVTGDIWNFNTAAISIDPCEIVVNGLDASYTKMVSVAINSTAGAQVRWTASCTDDWVIFEKTEGFAPETLHIGFNFSGLAVGNYSSVIEFNDGAQTLRVPVSLLVEKMQIIKMVTDYALPYIYLAHTSSTAPNRSHLIWYNTDTDSIEYVLDAGENINDLTVNYAENRIYVNNWRRSKIRVFDRTSKSELEPLLLGSGVYKINAAGAGLVITEGYWGGALPLRLLDTATGTTIASKLEHHGGGDCTLDGRYYYHTDSNTSGARLSRFRLTSKTFASEISVKTKYGYGSRNVFVSMDGSRVYNCGIIYDADLNQKLNIGAEIYAASAFGDLVITETKVFNGVNGQSVYSLPFSCSVMAFSDNQSELLLFNASSGSLTSLDTSAIMPIPEPKMVPTPADGSIQGANLTELSWSDALAATEYDIYFGTNAKAVTFATTNSLEYLGRRTDPNFQLSAGTLTGNETYFWRVDVVSFGNEIVTGDRWKFNTAAIAINPYEIVVDGVEAAYTQMVSVAINSTAGAQVKWTAACTNEWVVFEKKEGFAPETLKIGFDFSKLATGNYSTEIEFNDGAQTLRVPVSIAVEKMRIIKMATDYALPYIYMAHTSSTSPNKSLLIWYNTDIGAIEHIIDAGNNITDLTVSYADNRIYVSNWKRTETRVFDRASKSELEPLLLGTDVYKINAAGAGLVITEEENSTVAVRMQDTATGTSIASRSEREGDGDCTLDGRYYYHIDNIVGTLRLSRFTLTNKTFASEISIKPKFTYGSRNVFVNMDGSRVYNCGTIYDSDLNEKLDIGVEIYAASAYGDLVITATKAFNGVDGQELYSLPFSSSVMAFSGDQSELLLFNTTSNSLTSLATSVIMPIPKPEMTQTPTNGSILGANLPELSWTGVPEAIGYNVYIGTDSNAVASATTNSLEYLGRRTDLSIQLTEGTLTGRETYFWRVDIVVFGNKTVTGDMWYFNTVAIALDPYEIVIDGVGAAYTQMVSVAMTSTAGAQVKWTAACTNEWIVFEKTEGVAPETLNIGFDFSGLTAGTYSSIIEFNDGAQTLRLPVSLAVEKMRVIKMATDYTLPYIYLAHTSSTSPNKSLLIWYNTDIGAIENVIDAGENITDLTVSYADNRIYVSNSKHTETRVFDRTSKSELKPLLLGTDVYKINAAGAGLVITEEENQWMTIRIRDTMTGTTIVSQSEYAGDGDCTLDGRYYYHTDNRNLARLSRFTLTNKTFASELSIITKFNQGSRNVFVSMDGSRVYNCGTIYDADLNEKLDIGAEIYAASAHGNLVITGTKAFNGVNGQELYSLPFTSSIMAFSGDQSELLLFNTTSNSLTSLATSVIMPIPEPEMIPTPADGSIQGANLPELSWTGAPTAIGYKVYIGTDSNAVASATTNSLEYLGLQTYPNIQLTTGTLTGNETYFWRVDIVAFGNETVTGDMWNFNTAAIAIDPYEIVVNGMEASYTQMVSVAINSAAGAQVKWTASCTNDFFILEKTEGFAPETLNIEFDLSRLAAGTYSTVIEFNDGTQTLRVPVSLSVEKMRIIKMATDYTLPYIYLAHTSSTSPNKSCLIWYNTDTDSIEHVIDAGNNITDLTVSYADNRIYVNNWKRTETRVFDRTSKSELEPLLLGTDVNKINAAGAGLVITEGSYYRTITVRMQDTATGTSIASKSDREGDGDCTLDGRYYYHTDNGFSSARLSRFTLTNDTFASEISTRTIYYSGSRNVFVSMDGSRVYNCSSIYDADLQFKLYIGAEIYATSAYGDLVITGTKAFNGANGQELFTLPFSSSVMAFSGDQSELLLFNATSNSLTSLATSVIMPIPTPQIPCFNATTSLSETNWIYNASARMVTVTTDPPNLNTETTYNGSSTAPSDAGSYTVIGTINDELFYGSTTGTLSIAKADQTIQFSSSATQVFTNIVDLSADATSGLEVQFNVIAGPGTIQGTSNLSFSAAGLVRIQVTQPGDNNWIAAPPVTHTFNVIGIIANISPENGSELGENEITISGQWLGNGNDITHVRLCGVESTVISQDIHSVTVLSGATNITVRTTGDVEIESGFGRISLTNSFSYCPVPEPPTALSAIGITKDQFIARWMPSENTTHYYLDVSETTNFTSFTSIYSNWNAGPMTGAVVTGLVDGVTYWYRVRAASPYVSSLNSNLIEVPVSDHTPYVTYDETNGVVSASSSDVVDLTKFFHTTGIQYSVVSNSNPAMVSATIEENKLLLVYAEDASGTASITVRATYPSNGYWVESTFTVNIVPKPVLTRGTITLNPQNGLFEEVIKVMNGSELDANAVTLTISGLRTGETLYNATGTDLNGDFEILWTGTLAKNRSMNFTLQYYTPYRGTTPAPSVSTSLSLVDMEEQIKGRTFALSGEYRGINGSTSYLIEFNTTPGRTYYIQYTDSLANEWKTVRPGIVAPADRVQWIDSGPPGTECAPGDVASRFYRVIESTN